MLEQILLTGNANANVESVTCKWNLLALATAEKVPTAESAMLTMVKYSNLITPSLHRELNWKSICLCSKRSYPLAIHFLLHALQHMQKRRWRSLINFRRVYEELSAPPEAIPIQNFHSTGELRSSCSIDSSVIAQRIFLPFGTKQRWNLITRAIFIFAKSFRISRSEWIRKPLLAVWASGNVTRVPRICYFTPLRARWKAEFTMSYLFVRLIHKRSSSY